MITIGITGTLGAGKGTIVEHLIKTYGFTHYSVRDFIITEVKRRGLPINRDMTTLVANDLRSQNYPSYIIEELYKKALKSQTNSIIESVRVIGELNFLKKKDGFYLFAIDAEPKTRYERIFSRQSALDNVSFEKFLSDEKHEMENTDPTKGNIKQCIEHADFIFTNNGNIEDLQKKVNEVMYKILPQYESPARK